MYHTLDPNFTDPTRLKKEREKARQLKKTQWWLNQINRGNCHYCEKHVGAEVLTMDHIVPLARGGKSQPGNVVPACHHCNHNKKLQTPVELLLAQL
jgi:5-methylcytosine-specific restriction endonuclease McrA